MRARLLLFFVLAVLLCTGAFAAERKMIRAIDVREAPAVSEEQAGPADDGYPVVARDQARPSKINPLMDCYSGCLIRHTCGIWSGTCDPQPAASGCYYASGQPPCVCWDICW